MAKPGGEQAAVSMERERERTEDEEESCWVAWYNSNYKENCVLLTREGRPGELWRAI
jgi:hypothetical protein